MIARQIVKYSDKYIMENWRPERDVPKPVTRKVQGVTCRLFPSSYTHTFGDFSPVMLRELNTQAMEFNILIHHSGIHNRSLYLIAKKFGGLPIVAQQHGDCPPLFKFMRQKRPKKIIAHLLERNVLKNVDTFFVLRKTEIEFLSQLVPDSRLILQTMGVDFDQFKQIDKKLARKMLSLPQEKKILLYVGKFYQLKGVDIILRIFQELKKKYDVELILVGGDPSDQLYSDVRTSGARFYGYIPHGRMSLYFNSADVYLLPSFSPDYWGVDVTTFESLACGTPIVSTTLKDLPSEDRSKLGRCPKDENDVLACVCEILEDPYQFKDCREIARKYFDWRNLVTKTLETYDVLFKKYYGNKDN